jgi:hypothetical protein
MLGTGRFREAEGVGVLLIINRLIRISEHTGKLKD